MDCIYIEGLRVDCRIGIYEYEQNKEQPLFIDVTITYDNKNAGISDDYSSVIDYAHVAADIENLLHSNFFSLIETAAERISNMILQKYHAEKVVVKINKPEAVENARAVGIIIERTR